MRKYFIIGFILGSLIFGSSFALAYMGPQISYLIFSDIKVYLDGAAVTSDVEPFTYNGRVMVPVRAIGEALGKPVEWDENNNTVFIGVKPSSRELLTQKPIKQIDKINKSRTAIFCAGSPLNMEMVFPDNKVVGNGFCLQGAHGDSMAVHFDLQGRGEKLNTTIGLDCKTSNSISRATFRILGDGKELFQSDYFTRLTYPQDITIPVTGVNDLSLEVTIDAESERTTALYANPSVDLKI